jgi:uncharacterized membrane protein
MKMLKIDVEKNATAILLLILFFSTSLQVYNLSEKSLWLDEAASVIYASPPINIILSFQDVGQPPLYYLLLHFFLYFGKTEFVIRFFSVIFGGLCVLATYKLGCVFFDRKAGLLSSLFLASSLFFFNYAQDARMYTLFAFLSVLSLYLFYKAIKSGDNASWTAFTITSLLALYTHYFAPFFLVSEALFLFLLTNNY